METDARTYICEHCGREWHILVNTDPLVKFWERFAPRFCPACGARLLKGEGE